MFSPSIIIVAVGCYSLPLSCLNRPGQLFLADDLKRMMIMIAAVMKLKAGEGSLLPAAINTIGAAKCTPVMFT